MLCSICCMRAFTLPWVKLRSGLFTALNLLPSMAMIYWEKRLRLRQSTSNCRQTRRFQGSCRVSRVTMPLFYRPAALDPGSTTRCRSVPSYVFHPTTAPVFSPWLVRTAHVVGASPSMNRFMIVPTTISTIRRLDNCMRFHTAWTQSSSSRKAAYCGFNTLDFV